MKIIRCGTKVQVISSKLFGFVTAAIVRGSQNVSYEVSYSDASLQVTKSVLMPFEFVVIGEKIMDEIGFKQAKDSD